MSKLPKWLDVGDVKPSAVDLVLRNDEDDEDDEEDDDDLDKEDDDNEEGDDDGYSE